MTADRPHGFAEASPRPRSSTATCLVRGVGTDLGFEVETKRTLDFSSNRPKVLTYQSAKGLTFDTVLMPRLVRKSFTREPDDLIERLLLVGITHAMTWVYLSSTDPGSMATPGKIGAASGYGSLAVQQAGKVVGAGAKALMTSSGNGGGDELLGLL